MADYELKEFISTYDNLLNGYSKINEKIDEDLKQEIMEEIYRTLTKNREKQKNKKFLKFVRFYKSTQDLN